MLNFGGISPVFGLHLRYTNPLIAHLTSLIMLVDFNPQKDATATSPMLKDTNAKFQG